MVGSTATCPGAADQPWVVAVAARDGPPQPTSAVSVIRTPAAAPAIRTAGTPAVAESGTAAEPYQAEPQTAQAGQRGGGGDP
jgi:hypothetical protein